MCAMSAFIPTIKAKLKRASNAFTASGSRQYDPAIPVGISIVRVLNLSVPTSVRADTSGTKSFADESTIKGRALIHPCVTPKIDDLLEVGLQTFELKGVRAVYGMAGDIDHWEADLAAWEFE